MEFFQDYFEAHQQVLKVTFVMKAELNYTYGSTID